MYGIITSYVQFLIVIIIQIYWILLLLLLNITDNLFLKLIIMSFVPILVTLTSFFLYYLINTIFNIFVPIKWIEKDSGTLSFEKKIINNLFFNNYICNNIRNDSSTNNNLKQLTICYDNSNFENMFFKNNKNYKTTLNKIR